MNTYDNYRNTTPYTPATEPPVCNPAPAPAPKETVFSQIDNSNALAIDCYEAAARIFMALTGEEPHTPRDPVDKAALRSLEKLAGQLGDLRDLLGIVANVLGV